MDRVIMILIEVGKAVEGTAVTAREVMRLHRLHRLRRTMDTMDMECREAAEDMIIGMEGMMIGMIGMVVAMIIEIGIGAMDEVGRDGSAFVRDGDVICDKCWLCVITPGMCLHIRKGQKEASSSSQAACLSIFTALVSL